MTVIRVVYGSAEVVVMRTMWTVFGDMGGCAGTCVRRTVVLCAPHVVLHCGLVTVVH